MRKANQEEVRKEYKERHAEKVHECRRLRRRGRMLAVMRLVSFLVCVGAVIYLALTDGAWWPWCTVSVLSLMCYLVLRNVDDVNSLRIKAFSNICRVYVKEQKWLDGDFEGFDDGGRFVNPNHEYTYDMDVFGSQSIYQRMCRCVTSGGADELAEILSSCALGSGVKVEIDRRRDAVEEMVDKVDWRVEFMSYGQENVMDTSGILRSLNMLRSMKIGSFISQRWTFVVAWAAIVSFYTCVMLSVLSLVSVSATVWFGILLMVSTLILTSGPLRRMSRDISNLHGQLKAYIQLVNVILKLEPISAYNRRTWSTLTADGVGALDSFRELDYILDAIARRNNVIGMLLVNMLFLNDFFLLRRILKWQKRCAPNVESWIEAVSDIDAWVSMATFCYNNPQMASPEIIDGGGVSLRAKEMSHPFLGSSGVTNDFTIEDGNFYIITGANMAGKSTFLRSLGVNYILAMAGMPVFAEHFAVSVFGLFSSMRTSDNLANGVSYFNAELLRLRQLLECCKSRRGTLIILDEILKGTNSLDKLSGSRMFLESVSRLDVSGVVATHDLELSRMADTHPAFHNFCFEIGVADEITYSYKIAPGVAVNQNATYLLGKIVSETLRG